MAMSIKGVNTGVIRKANEFIALALKIKEPRNKESLFFLTALELRDLLIALESRLHQKHHLSPNARQQYEKARDFCHYMMPTVWITVIWNMTPTRNLNGSTISSAIIWRCSIVIPMRQVKHILAAPW